MGIRFRKSIRLGPGVRLNLGTKSAGLSFGVRGLRYSVNTSGKRTVSAGIPGTGVYYTADVSTDKRPARRASTQPTAGAVPIEIPRPGLFAPSEEKGFYNGLQQYLQQDYEGAYRSFSEASAKDSRNISDDFFAGLTAPRLGKIAEAMRFLETVVASDVSIPDHFMQKYVPSSLSISFIVAITKDVTVTCGLDSLGATLLLAELYQQVGKVEDAIGLLEQLVDDLPWERALALSLCELYYDAGDDEAILDTVQGISNDDDVSLSCLIYKGRALARRGLNSAAIETLGQAVRRTKGRNPELVKEARYLSAVALEKEGHTRRARAEFEKIYAEDRHYQDVAGRLGLP